jgi:DNA repair exonuclease SbcCD nuclease subunit
LKFVLVGDLHQRKQSPENRVDDFYSTLKSKIAEIVELGYSEGVDAFLFAGDFFDTPMPSMSVVSETTKLWLNGLDITELLSEPYKHLMQIARLQEDYERIIKQLLDVYSDAVELGTPEDRQKKLYSGVEFLVKDIKAKEDTLLKSTEEIRPILLQKAGRAIPLIGVAGNHDLYESGINALNRTMLGFLVSLGIVRLVSMNKPYIFKENGLSCAVTGTSYHADIDTEGLVGDYIVPEKFGGRHIHIIHGMLHDKSMGKKIKHTTVDAIAGTVADFTFAGHEHNGFPLMERDGKYFYNPGAVPRLSVAEVDRMPKVGLLTIGKETVSLKEHYIKCARQGSEVLNQSKSLLEKRKEEEFAEYRRAVQEAGKTKGYNAIEIINSIAANKNIKPAVRDKALEMVAGAMQKLDESGVKE